MTHGEYLELRSKIREYNEAYEAAEPVISDYEYDLLMQELKKEEAAHPDWAGADSPTQTAGAPVRRRDVVQVAHSVPMLSIEDVFDREAVLAWVREVHARYPEAAFRVEQKIDGLSMTVRYENGRLALAETRGDGYIGEDVTVNAAVISDVPPVLPEDPGRLEIRGEVYLTAENFEKINSLRELKGEKLFANPRNCAAGTLRQLNPAVTKERKLSFYAFNIQAAERTDLMESHEKGLAYLREKLGMKTVPGFPAADEEEVLDAIDRIGEMRGEYGYDIDGAVVKIDRIALRDEFRAGSKYSPGHIAYKYPPEEKETVIRDIEVSVGMTGRLNPTAVFDPVRLCGTTVTRATLHNQDFIDSLGLGIGDTVIVYKSGEIIPKIRAVVSEKRPAGTETYQLPSHCPSCGEPVSRAGDAADICCTNPDCPAQLVRRLVNFVGRDAMDIRGFGTENIRRLTSEGYLHNIADIYRLREYRDELVEKGLVGRAKNTDKLLGAIEASKEQEPSRLLTGLGIANVGRASAGVLLRHFGSIDRLMKASAEELAGIRDIGSVTADALVSFFADRHTEELIMKLREYGVRMDGDSKSPADGVLEGLTFCATGDAGSFGSRNALRDFIEERGGKLGSSVSRKTSALINNDRSSASSKNRKAADLGVPVMTTEEFLEYVKSKEPSGQPENGE